MGSAHARACWAERLLATGAIAAAIVALVGVDGLGRVMFWALLAAALAVFAFGAGWAAVIHLDWWRATRHRVSRSPR